MQENVVYIIPLLVSLPTQMQENVVYIIPLLVSLPTQMQENVVDDNLSMISTLFLTEQFVQFIMRLVQSDIFLIINFINSFLCNQHFLCMSLTQCVL